MIAGLLYVPLSSGGQDFIAFLRRGQPKNVHWAGKPYQVDDTVEQRLQPRRSFKVWSETVAGRCRLWTDEQLETAGVLALVYGKVSVYSSTCSIRQGQLNLATVVHRSLASERVCLTDDAPY